PRSRVGRPRSESPEPGAQGREERVDVAPRRRGTARSLLRRVRAEHSRSRHPGLFARLLRARPLGVSRDRERVPRRPRRPHRRWRDYPRPSRRPRGAVGVVAARVPQPVPEQSALLAHHRARHRERTDLARLRPIDAERGHLSLQGTVGRQAGTALLGVCDERPRRAAGLEPRQSQIPRRDRGMDAAAARDHQFHRTTYRQVDSVMSFRGRRPRLASVSALRENAGDAAIRIAYATAAAAFVAYAVWGTLFPFDFQPVPLETAARMFWSRWATDAGSLS